MNGRRFGKNGYISELLILIPSASRLKNVFGGSEDENETGALVF